MTEPRNEPYFTTDNPCQECGHPTDDLLAELGRLRAELGQRERVGWWLDVDAGEPLPTFIYRTNPTHPVT